MRLILPVLCVVLFVLTPTGDAAVIDFETDGSGGVLGPTSIQADEYAGMGLTIVDSDTTPGSTFLDPTNPLNGGLVPVPPITGNYVNVGAFGLVDTAIELSFAPGASTLSFDWATGLNATQILVTLFDLSDVLIGAVMADPTSFTFINDAGATVPGGSYAYAGPDVIGRALIEDEAGATRALILDNVNYTLIPEPATALLLGAGLIAIARRRAALR